MCVFSCPCMNFQLSVSAKRIKKSQDLELAVGAVFASQSLLQQSHVWSQSNLLQFCKQNSNRHLSVRMSVHHNFSCGGLLVSCDQRLSAVCLPPCRDWSCWAFYSLLRQDVNKLTEAFGQARRRNCSQAFYGGSRKFNTQMLSIFLRVEGGSRRWNLQKYVHYTWGQCSSASAVSQYDRSL